LTGRNFIKIYANDYFRMLCKFVVLSLRNIFNKLSERLTEYGKRKRGKEKREEEERENKEPYRSFGRRLRKAADWQAKMPVEARAAAPALPRRAGKNRLAGVFRARAGRAAPRSPESAERPVRIFQRANCDDKQISSLDESCGLPSTEYICNIGIVKTLAQ